MIQFKKPTSESEEIIINSEKKTRNIYDQEYARNYKISDAYYSGTSGFKFHRDVLNELCGLRGGRLTVLDFGCGTGRYFSALVNVERLIAVDVSAAMIDVAKSIESGIPTDFICGGYLALKSVPSESVDLIYSIGVLAEHAPLHITILDEFYRILRPNGVLWFSAADSSCFPEHISWKRRLARFIFPAIPSRIKRYFNIRWHHNPVSRSQLTEKMKSTAFEILSITEREETTRVWVGRHFYVAARKPG